MFRILSCLTLALLAGAAGAADPSSPYAGQEARDIKALSPQQIADYRAGRGMGLAMAAELNGYPGPAHVLELASELGLTPAQEAQTKALFRETRTAAAALGEDIVGAERDLDRLFASGSVTPEALAAATQRIGTLRARLRRVHLEAHVEQKEELTREQIAEYDRLRGYREHDGPGGHGHRGH